MTRCNIQRRIIAIKGETSIPMRNGGSPLRITDKKGSVTIKNGEARYLIFPSGSHGMVAYNASRI